MLLRADSSNPDFITLVSFLDAYLAAKDGDKHTFYHQYNKIDHLKYVVIAYEDDKAVGCGAIKEYENDTAEVKRMFVYPEYRGRGIASHMLAELELWAKELRYAGCILETGKQMTEAISLYKKSGYELIPNYGQYEGVDTSVCMRKRL